MLILGQLGLNFLTDAGVFSQLFGREVIGMFWRALGVYSFGHN